MRKIIDSRLEGGRIRDGACGSRFGSMSGAFYVVCPETNASLAIISNDACEESQLWAHVSVSHNIRTPTWEEMCWVKELFFTDDEAVLQFHPAKRDYVSNHPRCLHIWKPPYEIILPPMEFV